MNFSTALRHLRAADHPAAGSNADCCVTCAPGNERSRKWPYVLMCLLTNSTMRANMSPDLLRSGEWPV